jgi:hypothetical protein
VRVLAEDHRSACTQQQHGPQHAHGVGCAGAGMSGASSMYERLLCEQVCAHAKREKAVNWMHDDWLVQIAKRRKERSMHACIVLLLGEGSLDGAHDAGAKGHLLAVDSACTRGGINLHKHSLLASHSLPGKEVAVDRS